MKQYIGPDGVHLNEEQNKKYNETIKRFDDFHVGLLDKLHELRSNISVQLPIGINPRATDLGNSLLKMVDSMVVAISASREALQSSPYTSCTGGAVANWESIRKKCAEIFKNITKEFGRIEKTKKGWQM